MKPNLAIRIGHELRRSPQYIFARKRKFRFVGAGIQDQAARRIEDQHAHVVRFRDSLYRLSVVQQVF